MRQSLLDVWKYQHRLYVYGKIPAPLYRAFSKREYAEEFCSGRIRFQTLEYYKVIEDSERVDRTEGYSEITAPGESIVVDLEKQELISVPGVENIYAPTFEKSHFIYCLSLPKNGCPDPELYKFGSYFVKLNCPSIFLRDLAIAMQLDEKLNVNPPCLEATKVVYDKFDHYDTKPKRAKLNRMRWSQKPSEYSPEREYRIHFQACTVESISEDDTYYIQLKEPVKYCEILEA
ncbi:MAG: hypothetical protein ACJASL_004999 [Paraglaciecola sp.]|jgi:hypothetical protein